MQHKLKICTHDHATCPGDIKTIKCAYCNESLYTVNDWEDDQSNEILKDGRFEEQIPTIYGGE